MGRNFCAAFQVQNGSRVETKLNAMTSIHALGVAGHAKSPKGRTAPIAMVPASIVQTVNTNEPWRRMRLVPQTV